MEHESMKTRLGGVTILRAGAALALVAALAACGGGSGTTTAGGGGSQCAAGETLVGGDCLTAAQVTANTAITDARNAATALFGNIADPSQGDIEGLETAIGTAETAIAGLPEDEREEADDLLDNARTVLASAKGVRAALDAPSPGTEQVADSGVAALAALRAYEAAKAAEKSAHDAIKILGTGGTSGHALGGTLNVKGDSAKAAEYAKKILDAVSELEKQETAVANEVEAIEEAITAFEALDSDEVDDYADRLESLRDDLRSAKRHQTQIAAIQLESEEYRVQSQSGQRKPSAFASYVATAVQSAFDNTNEATAAAWLNGSDRIQHQAAVSADERRDDLTPHGNSESTAPDGYKKLDLIRVGTTQGYDVEDASLSLFTDLLSGGGTEDDVLTSTDATEAATTVRDVLYKGLRANLTCPTDATCGSEDGVLTGPWLLVENPTPVAATATLQGTTDLDGSLFREIEGVYRAFEGGYVEYGYWLEGTDGAPVIVTFAEPSADLPNHVAASIETGVNTGPAQAKYSGDALGISVIREVNPSDSTDVTSRKSGEFTADVSLTANFGTDSTAQPRLSGEITNFKGSATDSAWRVVLHPTDIPDGGVIPQSSSGDATGYRGTTGLTDQGAWIATVRGGGAGVRPTDVYGGFGAHFPNGEAVGGYQATKD